MYIILQVWVLAPKGQCALEICIIRNLHHLKFYLAAEHRDWPMIKTERRTGMAIPINKSIDFFKRACESRRQLTTILHATPTELASFNPDYFESDVRTCPAVDFTGPKPVFYKPKGAGDIIDKDRNCFHNTLLSLIPQSGFMPPLFGELQLLDVACGEAFSAQPFANFFGSYFALQLPFFPHFNSFNKNSTVYTGVDINAAFIDFAKSITPNNERFNFVTADAMKFMKGGKKYDVILIRHPGPLENDKDAQMWGKIIADAYATITNDGLLMVTTYNCFEYLFVLDVLKNEPHVNIPLEGMNPHYFVFDRADGQRFARDRYVIFADKKSPRTY